MSGCFDQLPATLEQALLGSTDGTPLLAETAERVCVVYVDAFGWRFVERQESHPLLRRVRAEGRAMQIESQFPSTTTAHVTTIHTGLPVVEHGLYEWHVYEPLLDRLVTPLFFSYAGDKARDTLAGALDPADLFPRGPLHGRLRDAGVAIVAAMPAGLVGSTANRALLGAAEVLPFEEPADGVAAAAAALAGVDRGYVFVYLDQVDGLMHDVGSEDAALVDAAFAAQLSAVHEAAFPPGTLVLLTADHGMTPVDPARTIYLNELWPELGDHLRRGADGKPLAPAGSCRDVFLHVLPGELETVRDELAERLGARAEVVETSSFFPSPAPALARRLGELVVLPAYGEAVWWHEPGRFVQHMRAQHGGLTPHEREIPLLAWVI